MVAPRVLPDPPGPLSSEVSPSAIAEVNAAVNGVQQAKTKELRSERSIVRTVRECEYGD